MHSGRLARITPVHLLGALVVVVFGALLVYLVASGEGRLLLDALNA
jgi:hypothetical protein